MKNFFLGTAVTLVGFVFLQSCTYDKQITAPLSNCPDTLNVSFIARVKPLLEASCFSCHGNGASQGNVSLETHDKVKQLAISGRLLGSISHATGFSPMPQGAAKLSSCNITAVETWIREGSQNN